MVLLENVSNQFDHHETSRHDNAMKNGTAQGFARSLHQQFMQNPLGEASNVRYSLRLAHTRALQIAVMCRALDNILRCSDKALEKHGRKFVNEHLVPSLPRGIKILAHWKGDSTLRLVTLSSAIRILRRIAPFSDKQPVETMCLLLQDNMPSDIRIDAAHALADFLEYDAVPLQKEVWSRLVSILSTSATVSSKGHESLDAIARLLKFTPFRAKLAQRRSCIVGIQKSLVHDDSETRKLAIEIATSLVSSPGDDEATGPSLFETTNQDLLAQGIIQAALKETNPKLLMSLLKALATLNQHHLPDVAKVYFVIAVDKKYDETIAIAAARSYVSVATDDMEVLSNVIDFATHSNDTSVRAQALEHIQEVCFWKPATATKLLTETALLENMSQILASDRASTAILRLAQQLCFDSTNRPLLLQHSGFLKALVDFVVNPKHRSLLGIDLVLDLLSDQPAAFCDHPQLLPWMVSLANRTSSDDLKVRLVAAIVPFSSVYMQ